MYMLCHIPQFMWIDLAQANWWMCRCVPLQWTSVKFRCELRIALLCHFQIHD